MRWYCLQSLDFVTLKNLISSNNYFIISDSLLELLLEVFEGNI